MSFLQPAMLLALPFVALPIIIHLINQRRFHTVHWGAMRFLLAANRMSRGYARIRQWLILAARTLAIAGLIFAISRPLSSGWLGLAGGGQVDTTLILIDRSPSMSQLGPGGLSKFQTGLSQLQQSLGMLNSGRYVLIDSANLEAREIESPDQLMERPEATAVSQSADLPAMLEVASEYIAANRPSRCEVWICSDIRRNDWDDDSGRWDAIRNSFAELPQMVRIHLLAYPQVEQANRSIRVTDVRRVESGDRPRLLISLRVEQLEGSSGQQTIPIRLDLNGARSEFTAEMSGTLLELRDHPIPLDRGKTRGWGRVSIASDASPFDNDFYFVYDKELPRKTIVVADNSDSVRPLEFATSLTPSPEIELESRTVTPPQFLAESIDDVALILWRSQIPAVGSAVRSVLDNFLKRGGQLVFFPPEEPEGASFAGLSWGQWREDGKVRVATWVGDQDLLANTRSGSSLPLGELLVSRHCTLVGDRIALATLDGGQPLLARATTDRRNVYFCATTTSRVDSTLARGGVVLYVMLQRALAAGAQTLGNTRLTIAGETGIENSTNWRQVAGDPAALSSHYDLHAGVYQADEQLLAVNRSPAEDLATIVPAERVEQLFAGLDFDRVDDQAGSGVSLIQEVWRLFLLLMLVAMILEAALCLPKRAVTSDTSSAPWATTTGTPSGVTE